MGKATIWDDIREWIGGIAFDIFLWSVRLTEEDYHAALEVDFLRDLERENGFLAFAARRRLDGAK